MDDVLSLWENFAPSIKAASLLILITYLTTLMSATMWVLDPLLTAVLLFWPFIGIVWFVLVWLGFTLIVMFGAVVGRMAGVETTGDYKAKLIRVAVFVPVIIGMIVLVASAFMVDIFTRENGSNGKNE